jgi:hypothetical protein
MRWTAGSSAAGTDCARDNSQICVRSTWSKVLAAGHGVSRTKSADLTKLFAPTDLKF